MNETSNLTRNLLDVYSCCICTEPMELAVSFNPCGHELDEGCANAILSSMPQCPVCRVDVDSFRPAYITRQSVEVILKNITIHVKRLTGSSYTYKMDRDSKTIELFKLIFADTKIHPSRVKLLYDQKSVSLFSHLSEYIPSKEIEFNFFMSERLGHWTSIAKDYPMILKQATAEVGSGVEQVYNRFSLLYKEAIDQAMKS